ncbi:MAG: hypothetical protein JOZ81_14075 [Chloroflexi bacterium]|nr:hypothetical protein [Chloroflexota bacterium]
MSARFTPWMAVLAVSLVVLVHPLSAAAQSTSACGLANAAFCDTFDAPKANGGRGGPLDPVWGVSRVTGSSNLNQGYENAWADTDIIMCDGSTRRVSPPDDIQICNGQLREAINDTGMNNLAMYPRQPFDIAGRTGTVSFDVSNDSGGGHQAWPAFSFTDQPTPAPLASLSAFPGVDYPRNSLTIEFDGYNGRCVSVGSVATTANWAATAVPVVIDDCVLEPAQESFAMNHVEIHISQSGFEVWMSDAGTRNMKKVAHANVNVPLTRGLVWIRDVHYSGDKICHEEAGIFCQGMHTFAWDNFAFDGPVLPRDLGIQLPDQMLLTDWANKPDNGYPVHQLGWALNAGVVPPGVHHIMNFSGAQALHDVEKASAAIIVMQYDSPDQVTFNYSVNGHSPHTQPWNPIPQGDNNVGAFPVPLSELVDGNNTIDFWVTNDPNGIWGLSQVDMILLGAGGGGGGGSDGGGSSTPPATPTPTATMTATPGTSFTQSLNRGDSVQITCASGTLSIVTQSGSSDVLKCS